MGQPSGFTQEIADDICAKLSKGMSLRSICRDDKMPSTSMVFRWLRDNKVFRDQYIHARDDQAETIFDQMVDIADESVNDFIEVDGREIPNQEAIQRSRLRIDTRKWVLGKMKPKKYGDHLDVDVIADVTHNYQITTKDKVDPEDIGYTES
jgi:hypothetical protein